MKPVPLDEIEEYVLAVSKHYAIPYTYVMDEMYYPDVTVLYAKMANENAFTAYSQYIQLDEESRSKHVMDWGEPKPYVYEVITPEVQRVFIENSEATQKLRGIYRQGGRYKDD